MSNEADKVINLSLCKMAESRGTRRGGSSLHKHLLIASVLTKATRARSAFLDTWYIGDDDASEDNVDLNMSYQEADFPTEELDSTVGESSKSLVDPNEGSSRNLDGSTHVSEVESDIDLPPDILSCVEKIGDLSNRMFSQPQPSASITDASSATDRPDCTNITHPDVISNAQSTISQVSEESPEDTQLSTTLTYLDLDAGSPTIVERGLITTSTPSKRRREWCFEDEEEDDQIQTSHNHFIETPIKAQNSLAFGKKCKRLRFDGGDDSGVASPEKSLDETGVPSRCAENDNNGHDFKAGSFRLTYEEVDADDSDDDSFLEDALSESLQTPSHIQMAKTRDRNDRRVPSASSSSGSCSDEDVDGENSMEVDQITNLVQFISFNKQQSQAQNSSNLRSISCVN